MLFVIIIILTPCVVGWYHLFTELQDITVLMDCMYKQAGCLFLFLFVHLVQFLFVVECSPFLCMWLIELHYKNLL